jgi:hypothetical protein
MIKNIINDEPESKVASEIGPNGHSRSEER